MCEHAQYFLFTGMDPFDGAEHLFALGLGAFFEAVKNGARPSFPDEFAQARVKAAIESCWKPVGGGRFTVKQLATAITTAAATA